MGVRPRERVLVVDDGSVPDVVRSICVAAVDLDAELCRLPIDPLPRSGAEPPRHVREALIHSDAALLLTSRSLTHTEARRAATASGTRIASMPGITSELFERGLGQDYRAMEAGILAWADRLSRAETARLQTAAGTDLHLVLRGRAGHAETGLYTSPGAVGNLPAGEASISPVEGTTCGTLVVDGSLAGFGLLSRPLVLTVEDGYVVDAEGPYVEELLALAAELGRGALAIAELGVGANPGLSLTGASLGDEKVRGTVHIGFGNNVSFGGTVNVPSHVDGIVTLPTLDLDGERIMEAGRWLIATDV